MSAQPHRFTSGALAFIGYINDSIIFFLLQLCSERDPIGGIPTNNNLRSLGHSLHPLSLLTFSPADASADPPAVISIVSLDVL